VKLAHLVQLAVQRCRQHHECDGFLRLRPIGTPSPFTMPAIHSTSQARAVLSWRGRITATAAVMDGTLHETDFNKCNTRNVLPFHFG
jgi:hypothetical protein